MERRQRGNPSAPPSSASSSSRFHSQKSSLNTPKTGSFRNDVQHLRSRHGNPQRSEQEEEEGRDSNDLPSLVGTCAFMCPAGERAQRERLRDLAVFERLHGNPGKTSPSLAVKKFCRTIATKQMQASDVRPPPVLAETLNYLLNLLDSTEQPFEVIHDFIFDRTRSIRQDLSMQNIVNDQTIQMYEEMVKFHIISHHKLQSCRSRPGFSSVHYLNMEQLKKCLASLYALYKENQNSNSIFKNEPEFHSFHVLLHLGSSSQPLVDPCICLFALSSLILASLATSEYATISVLKGESLSLWLARVPSLILKSKEMCFARRLLRLFRVGNYKCFLRAAASEASYLQYYIIEPYIDEVRALALLCVNNCGYKLHPYPIGHLSKLLLMKESDVESFCHACGLETSTDELGNKFLPTKQTNFHHPKEVFPSYQLLGLECLES